MSPELHINRTKAATTTLLNALDEARAVLFENDKAGMAVGITDEHLGEVLGTTTTTSGEPPVETTVPNVTAVEFNASIYSLGQIVSAAESHTPALYKLKR